MKIIGPIEVTENSHPFSSMKFSREIIHLEDYNFIEEEYFIEDRANVYDLKNNQVEIFKEDLPFTTRILVRRPKNSKDFTGILYVDIMNASNGYDIEDLWRRSYLHIMENNHAYVGITTKPINVLALKNFDYERYKSLNWSNGEIINAPATIDPLTASIEGTEEGLVWDILLKTGLALKRGDLPQIKADYIYLTGQSQSGIYLNTFVNYMHNYYKKNNLEIPFDGYLSLASGGLGRALRQIKDSKVPMSIKECREEEIDRPVITFNAEGDYKLFESMGSEFKKTRNENTDKNKRRYYEMAGAPHTNAASPLVPKNEEIVKTKCPARLLDSDYDYRLNDLPFDFYINSILDFLHDWAKNGNEPPIIEPLKREKGKFVKDKYGNTLGGIRSPFLEVPKAKYLANAEDNLTNGIMEFFPEEKIKEIYGSFENYIEKFEKYALNQVKEKMLTKNDAERAIDWAKNIKK